MDSLMLKEGTDVSDMEKTVKNKWRWAWLNEMGDDGKPFGSWCKKMKMAGVCFCVVCHEKISYGSNGKKVLLRHQSKSIHKANARSLQHTSSLPGATTTTTEVCASMADRVCSQKVRICSFIAEHDLSLTIAQPLVDLIKVLAEDQSALSRLSLSNAQASYMCTHGITAQCKAQLAEKLQGKMLSLNADEATNLNLDRILNVLVRFFDEDMGKVVTQHLGSRMVNIADASTVTNSMEDILQSYNLNWDQVVSALMDNCNVMRGKRSGVETQIRQKNPCLLDVSGDTVHMVSNSAKALLRPFKNFVEDFCTNVYYDIEKFPKQKEIFSEFQSLLHMDKKSLIRPISSRFLQMLDVSSRVRELLDPLIAHYYSFLSPHDQRKYRWLLNQVLQKHGVTSEEKARVNVLQQQLEKSTKGQTDANSIRKTRISVLFTQFDKLTTMMDLYRGILPFFKVFVKTLQHEKPMLHVLHVEMVLLVRDILSKFMKPDAIPLDVKGLLKVDVQDRSLHLPDKWLATGTFSHCALNKARVEKKSWVGELYTSLREGYVKAATFLLKNLPLDNKVITSLSALSPSLIQDEQIRAAFSILANSLPNIIPSEELGQLDEEVREYQIDLDLVLKAKDFQSESRIDVDWWREVFLMKKEGEIRFPVLGKLVGALLSIFTGPLVEGSFNIMDDIVEKDRVRLNLETYEGFAIIKTHLKAAGETASKMKISPSMRSSCLSSYSRYRSFLLKKKEKINQEKQRKIKEAVKVLAAVKVKKVKTAFSPAATSTGPKDSFSTASSSSKSHKLPGRATPKGHLLSPIAKNKQAGKPPSSASSSSTITTTSSSTQAKRPDKGKPSSASSTSSGSLSSSGTAAHPSSTASSSSRPRKVSPSSHLLSPTAKSKQTAKLPSSSSITITTTSTTSSSTQAKPVVNPPKSSPASSSSSGNAPSSGAPFGTPPSVPRKKSQKRASGVAKLDAFGFTLKKQKK